jgi:hypothetical protein
MVRRTIALATAFVSLVLQARFAAQALPSYSSGLILTPIAYLSQGGSGPSLFQAGISGGGALRYGLPLGIHVIMGAGLLAAAPSVFSAKGQGYRGFMSAWGEGCLGWDSLDGSEAVEVSLSLHSGSAYGTFLAQAMLGAALNIILRDPSSLPTYSRFLSGGRDLPLYRAELCIPLGFLVKPGSFSLYTGLGLRLWMDPLGSGQVSR